MDEANEEAWWFCGVCDAKMAARTPSLGCMKCLNYIHLKGCSGISYKEALQSKGKYTCPKCVDSSAAPVEGSGEEVLVNGVTNKDLINESEVDIECEGDSVPDQYFLLYKNIAD